MKIIESNPQIEEIGFRELRLDADSIIEGVNSGKTYVVSRKSKALFKIVPLEEDVWDTVIDFTQITPHGADIDKVLATMETMKQSLPKKYGRSNTEVSR